MAEETEWEDTELHCPDCMGELQCAGDGTYPCPECGERWAIDDSGDDTRFIDMMGYEVTV